MWNKDQEKDKMEIGKENSEKKAESFREKTSPEKTQQKEKKETLSRPEEEKQVERKRELNIYDKILTKVKQKKTSSSKEEIKEDAHQTWQAKTADEQVEMLVKLAQSKGVVHAVKVAQRLDNYYILDKLHDQMSLGERMYQALQKEKIIE